MNPYMIRDMINRHPIQINTLILGKQERISLQMTNDSRTAMHADGLRFTSQYAHGRHRQHKNCLLACLLLIVRTTNQSRMKPEGQRVTKHKKDSSSGRSSGRSSGSSGRGRLQPPQNVKTHPTKRQNSLPKHQNCS